MPSRPTDAPVTSRMFRPSLALILFAALAQAAPLVVETAPLSPEEQRAKFHLPPGFEIQLVVSETDIGQPMNLNFDAAGNLWVTHSVEYPYPVEGEGVEPRDGRFQGMGKPPARDRVTVLSGIGPDGKPKSIVHFASGLNIPIGVVPISHPTTTSQERSTIVFTIPYITRFTDTNGDGVSDKQEKLYGPFGNLDTHGMTNSFTRWIDGWIYACHGFRNTSTVKGTDGHEFTMNSGNTFRFQEDGSRIEQFSWGQVNPFGLAFDRWGNFYNADCHSMPLTCVLQGAYYQSFGKPHDGLGYGPDMLDHNHGSTGICGVAWYEAAQFPREYQDCIYLCNPVNGQVHRDRIQFRGSSPWCDTQPDFVTCDDGWFRPVDVKLGPDGALYIADFYNSIIGHYEVPLDHPLRDRTHGRVWRVVYRGENQTAKPESVTTDLTKLSSEELVQRLGDPNILVRMHVTNELVDRGSDPAVRQALIKIISSSATNASERAVVCALWAELRLGGINNDDGPTLLEFLAKSPSALVRVHVAHLLEALPPNKRWTNTLLTLLQDQDPQVLRAAARAAANRPSSETLQPLLVMLARLTADAQGDTHLLHAVKMAVRNHVGTVNEAESRVEATSRNVNIPVVDIALGARNRFGARLARMLIARPKAVERREELVRHASRYLEEKFQDTFVKDLRSATTDLDQQLRDLDGIRRGQAEQGFQPSAALRDWATDLAKQLLNQETPAQIGWTETTLEGGRPNGATFVVQERTGADAQSGLFFCTLPNGEQRTGVYRSNSFSIPRELSFFIAGHNAFPGKELKGTNLVRLRDRDTGTVLAETAPPRNDTAQRVVWDLSDHQGASGIIEIVDGDTDTAYAWLAVGRFSVEGLNPGAISPLRRAVDLIVSMRLGEFGAQLAALARSTDTPESSRLTAAEAVVSLQPFAIRQTLLLGARTAPSAELREKCLQSCLEAPTATSEEVLRTLLQNSSQPQQVQLANQLASDQPGGKSLLAAVTEGKASALLLTRVDLVERLKALGISDLESQVSDLTRNLPPANEQVAILIQHRRAVLDGLQQPDLVAGQALFKKHCAACHQFKGEGNKIGPQLDGVANRGPDRLLEDILDPNRNIDAAFRTTAIALKSGQVLTGLKRREEGATIVFANNEGKEFTVKMDDIDEQKTSPLSLMPANLGEQVPEQDFAQLLRFLLAK